MIKSLPDLQKQFKGDRPVVIDRLLRAGEIISISAAPKMGVSSLAMDLAISVAIGGSWIGLKCSEGKVLVIDTENRPKNTLKRIMALNDIKDVRFEDIGQKIDLFAPWKHPDEITSLDAMNENIGEKYKLIVIDSFDKFMPLNTDENSNSDISRVFQSIDRLAERCGAAIAITCKLPKNNRPWRRLGAGSSAQSRACDADMILREHESDKTYVVDCRSRSFPPVESFLIRQDRWPLWSRIAEATK